MRFEFSISRKLDTVLGHRRWYAHNRANCYACETCLRAMYAYRSVSRRNDNNTRRNETDSEHTHTHRHVDDYRIDVWRNKRLDALDQTGVLASSGIDAHTLRLEWGETLLPRISTTYPRSHVSAHLRRVNRAFYVRCAALGVVGTMTLPRGSHSRDDDVLLALSLCLNWDFFFFHKWCRSRVMVPRFHGTKRQTSTLSVAGKYFFMILNGWDDCLVIDLVFSESRYQVRYWLLYLTDTYKYSVGYSNVNN